MSAAPDIEVSSLSSRAESRRWPSCSSGLMPGMIGVAGVLNPEGISRLFSGLSSDPVLGTSSNDPLSSVVSRDSASSSDSRVGNVLVALAA